MSMEERRFRHSVRVDAEAQRRLKGDSETGELSNKIMASLIGSEGSVDSAFEASSAYLTDGFERQADGLRTLRGINDKEVRRRKAIPLLQKRKNMLNSLKFALGSHSFTELEDEQLRWLYNMGSAFSNYLSKNLGIFETQYGMSREQGSVLSSVSTVETLQCLAEILVAGYRQASDVESVEHAPNGAKYLEETAFALFHSMAVKAMGLEAGTHLYNITQSGARGMAAAYLMYSDATKNRFGKSFRVFFPPPHLDALEQTDLLLVDEEGMSAEVRQEIMSALEAGTQDDYDAINKISDAAKQHVYKVQVKMNSNGKSRDVAQDTVEREKFASARCTSKGFDNYDYLVLNNDQVRDVLRAGRPA